MLSQEKIQEIIFSALKNINEERDADKQIGLTPVTPLFGEKASLDSLSLVSLIVDVESGITELIGKPISLTDDRAMSQIPPPFSDVTALVNYISLLVSEK